MRSVVGSAGWLRDCLFHEFLVTAEATDIVKLGMESSRNAADSPAWG